MTITEWTRCFPWRTIWYLLGLSDSWWGELECKWDWYVLVTVCDNYTMSCSERQKDISLNKESLFQRHLFVNIPQVSLSHRTKAMTNTTVFVCLVFVAFSNGYIALVIFIFQGRPKPGSRGGGPGGMFGFGQTTAKVIKDDIGVRFK